MSSTSNHWWSRKGSKKPDLPPRDWKTLDKTLEACIATTESISQLYPDSTVAKDMLDKLKTGQSIAADRNDAMYYLCEKALESFNSWIPQVIETAEARISEQGQQIQQHEG